MLRIGGLFLTLFTLFNTLLLQSSDEIAPLRSPAEELETFELAEGFQIELAVSEPLIEDPVLIKFDEKGRMWVVEMRGYMMDIEGTDQEAPNGRVVYLEDSNGDGTYDKKTTYADNLVLPRAIQFFPDGVLIAENIPLWFFEDTDGDGVSDKKTLVDAEYGGRGMPEHAANGLILGEDGWLYNAKSQYRYKRNGDEWIKEETEFRGQWGIDKDDLGRLYYNYNWSQLHADLVQPNLLNRNPNYTANTGIDHGLTIERRIFPIHPTPAVNRGYIPGTLDSEGKLLEFTSACSPYVHRNSTSYPADFMNNVLVCEPAGNLVKRNKVKENGYYLEATNAYPDKEFLASTDERFRPVYIASGPDGAIYLVDMYRGINQDGAYMTEYLRGQILERGLDKYVHLGRIWKITPDNFKSAAHDDLSQLNANELVANLSHPIAWTREESKRLLIQKQMKESTSALEKLTKQGIAYARLSALTVLDNLGTLTPDLCKSLLRDENPDISGRALALLAKMNGTQNSAVEGILKEQLSTSLSDKMALQLVLASDSYSEGFAQQVISYIIAQKGEDALLRDAALSALSNREFGLINYLLNDQNWAERTDHQEIFLDQLAAIIIRRQNAAEINGLLKILADKNNWQTEALLAGASTEAMSSEADPLALSAKPALFERNDLAIERLQKAFTWQGKKEIVKEQTATVTLDAAGRKQFAAGRQAFLTYCVGCHGANGKGVRRFAPPLAGSEWVTGDVNRLALILLHGIEGPINVKNQHFDVPEILPVMPSHSTLADGDIANILTYIRNEWGHSSEPVSGRTVAMLRVRSQGKVVPWTAPELNEHIAKQTENK